MGGRLVARVESDVTDVATVVIGRFDALVLRGLKALFGEDRSVCVLESGLDRAALEAVVVREVPQVVILDRRAGYATAEQLRATVPQIGVLLLLHEPSRADVAAAHASGVACIAVSAADADLLGAVRLVAQGEAVVTSDDGHRVERRAVLANADALTGREREVLSHLSRARSDAQIALALRISVRTVEKHVARIRLKLRVADRRELIGVRAPGAV